MWSNGTVTKDHCLFSTGQSKPLACEVCWRMSRARVCGPGCANKFTKVLRAHIFSDIIVGFALQKAWLSAQTEAQRVVRGVNDGSKTDFCGLAARLTGKKYKLGIKK
jgi:hypothetical protein